MISEPEVLPTTDADIFWTYMVAPFWADFETTSSGVVSWEVHDRTNSEMLLARVDDFIEIEYGDANYEGSWMLVAFWENVTSAEDDNVSYSCI